MRWPDAHRLDYQASQKGGKNKGLETGKGFGGLFVLGQDYATSGWKSVFLSFLFVFLPFFHGCNGVCEALSSHLVLSLPRAVVTGFRSIASRIALMQ